MAKTMKLTIRLSPEDMAVLKSHTAKTHLSQSAYRRKLIHGYIPKEYPPEVYYELLGVLNQNGKVDADTLLKLQEAVTAPEKMD